jgi:hypothetical protein
MAGSGTIKTQKKYALGVPCAACLYRERGHSGKHETHKDYQERAEMEDPFKTQLQAGESQCHS